jgi:hypothetical protein
MSVQKVLPTDRFSRTEAGRMEIRTRTHALSRTARNLLLIIDESRPGLEWVTMVHGAAAVDLQDLLDAHLVAQAGPGAPPAAAGPAPQQARGAEARRPPPPADTLPGTTLSYSQLQAALAGMVREELGLLKSYRFTQEIERAAGLEELADVAWKFVEVVRENRGDSAAREVQLKLRLV